jgi:hypothetical protein
VAFNQDLNPHIDTLIMQIGWFGTSLVADISHSRKGRFKPLIDYLRRFYPEEQAVRVMAAPYSAEDAPVVISTKLGSLDQHHKKIMPVMSMFIPALPVDESSVNEEFIRRTVDVGHLKEVALMNAEGS